MASISSTRIATELTSSGVGLVIEAYDEIDKSLMNQVLISETVPAGKTWRIQYGHVLCRGYGRWSLYAGASRIGGGLTNPSEESDRHTLPDFLDVPTGETVEMVYLYSHGPDTMPIDAFIGIIEF